MPTAVKTAHLVPIPKTSLNSRLRKGAIAGDLVRLTEGRGLRPGSDLPGKRTSAVKNLSIAFLNGL